ncbi:MAG: cytochrome c biogenesis protein DipZ [Candidatus Babeliales bacterium]
MILLLLFAGLAGLVTVLSPCILPVLPLLLSASVGQGRYRSLGVITGLVLSFSFFTLTLTALIQATGISPDFLRYCAIGLITFFGLTMLFPWLGDRFAAMTSGFAHLGSVVQEQSTHAGTGFVSGCILGIALGLLWTPCAGPILASITTLVATRAVTWNAVLVTLAYSIGAALPMFAITYGGNKIINSTQRLAGYTEIIRKIFGVLMIVSALALAFHVDVVLQQIAANYFPMINIEDTAVVKKALEELPGVSSNSASTESGAPAPDLIGLHEWINSTPLTLEQLRGKVVLIDFWTYSCINCVRTLPHVKHWYDSYKDKGFVVIGVHTPEFAFEKSVGNVQGAIKRFGITYPVALDNEYATWQNYSNHYWPAHYLIDQHGVIQEKHFGEGAYLDTENAIRKLLALTPLSEKKERVHAREQTPETYLGYERGHSYGAEQIIKKDSVAAYNYTHHVKDDQVALKGMWIVRADHIESHGADTTVELNFIGSHVYLVMQSATPQQVNVLLDGKTLDKRYYTPDMNKQGEVMVHEARMYEVLDFKGDYGRHLLTLHVPAGVWFYVFTFGV